jgi:hypothetical protein
MIFRGSVTVVGFGAPVGCAAPATVFEFETAAIAVVGVAMDEVAIGPMVCTTGMVGKAGGGGGGGGGGTVAGGCCDEAAEDELFGGGATPPKGNEVPTGTSMRRIRILNPSLGLDAAAASMAAHPSYVPRLPRSRKIVNEP